MDEKKYPHCQKWTVWILLVNMVLQIMTAVSYHHNINQVWDAVHQVENIQLQQTQLLNQRLMLHEHRLIIQDAQLLEILRHLESLINTQ